MAEKKTKKTAASNKTKKKAPAAKKTKKKPVTQKAKTTSKKVVKKTAPAKKAVPKKGTSKKAAKTTKKTSPKSSPKKKKNMWMIPVAIVIIIILLLLGIASHSMKQEDVKEEQEFQEDIILEENQIELIVVEDPQCANCQVDLYVAQIKEFLIPDLVVQKVDMDSENGKQVLQEMDASYVPVYLFSEEITKRSDWQSSLSSAFVGELSINSKRYFVLNSQVVESKKLIKQLPITENTVVLGNPDAQVTVYEFSDFECPFCALAEGNELLLSQYIIQNPGYEPIVPALFEQYVDKGLVRYVFYNYHPLHPTARDAHIAALCAHEQDEFKAFSELLFSNQQNWAVNFQRTGTFNGYASQLGLDTNQFEECFTSRKYDQQIEDEIIAGQELGIAGTPVFVVDDFVVQGAQDFSIIDVLIRSALQK